MTIFILIVTSLMFYFGEGAPFPVKNTEDEAYWVTQGQNEIDESPSHHNPSPIAKNVILAIGDGMGISTVTAARIHQGQGRGEAGEGNYLHFERFPHVALVKTYSLNKQVADSASTATAIMSGVKVNSAAIGVTPEVKCGGGTVGYLTTILDWSLKAGKSVGIVTHDQVTGATPASTYAHAPHRHHEDDSTTPAGCRDIARQLIEDNPDINVILGGGLKHFISKNNTLYPWRGLREDGRDFIQEWKDIKQKEGANYAFVTSSHELDDVNTRDVDYLFGLFATGRMPRVDQDRTDKPSLQQMTTKAIEILSKNTKGFFLLVEGANIDTAHHSGLAQVAIRETVEFDAALAKADTMIDQSNTLFVVTADHSHVFTISGYPERGNGIFLLSTNSSEYTSDGQPYTTLGYSNGPGYMDGHTRPLISDHNLTDAGFRYSGGAPKASAPHGGEDVAVYARGPMSHLLHGVREQSYIGHVLAYATCTGNTRRKCDSSCAPLARSEFFIVVVLMFVKTMM